MPAIATSPETHAPRVRAKPGKREKGKERVCLRIVRLANPDRSKVIARAILAGDKEADSRRRLADIYAAFGRSAAGLLRVPSWKLESLLHGRRRINAQERGYIWLLWTLRFEPHKLRTWFDVLTWGKFSK